MLERRKIVRLLLFIALAGGALWFVVRFWSRVYPPPAGSGGLRGPTAGAATVASGTGASGTGTSPSATSPAVPPPAGGSTLPASGGDYFAAAHLQRDQAESRELDQLRQLASASGTAATVRAQAEEQILGLEERQQQENAAELVLAAKGYPESLVILRPEAATVVVSAASFDAADAALVGQAVAAVAGIDPSAVQIVPRTPVAAAVG